VLPTPTDKLIGGHGQIRIKDELMEPISVVQYNGGKCPFCQSKLSNEVTEVIINGILLRVPKPSKIHPGDGEFRDWDEGDQGYSPYNPRGGSY
jgi:hypothetical protein